jgi:oligopeptide transport system substrate-binding protein
LLYDIKNARAYNEGKISASDKVGVRAIDKLTLEVTLQSAASYFLHVLTTFYPVPGHVVEACGDTWTDLENIVTNGAFTLESYEPGESMSLVKDPTYHRGFSGNLERVEVNLSESQYSAEELELYEKDCVDIAFLSERTIHARHKYAEEHVSMPMQSVYFVGFDTSRPPFADVRVRRAFTMAVDRERLANEVFEGLPDPVTGGFVPPSIPGHSPGIGLPYDPAQARQLLAEAGYPEGQGLILDELVWIDAGRSMPENVKSQWTGNLNVEVTVEIMDWESVLDTSRSRNVFFGGWGADYPDPDSFLRVGVRNLLPRWQNDQFDLLLEKAQRTLDQSERMRFYQEADKILVEEAVVIPTAYPHQLYLVKPWAKTPVGKITDWDFKDVILEPH